MLRFVEFLILLLHTQSQTLTRLAAFYGEDELIELLELAGEHFENHPISPATQLPEAWFLAPPSGPTGSAYAELEMTVKELRLAPRLEFHLWAYPYYRSLIESQIPLNSIIDTDVPEALDTLIEQAIFQAKEWIKAIPVVPNQARQVETLASVPWLRFRAEILTLAGKKPVVLAQSV